MTGYGKIMPNAAASALTGPFVVVLAYDGLCTFEFGVAYEVFGLPRPEMGESWFRYGVAGIEPGPLRAAGGLHVQVEGDLALLAQADLVVVPGWRAIDAPVPAVLVEALQAAHRRGARMMSLCSGIAVLAACGFLEGRRATTHWRYVEAIAGRYPAIALAPDSLYVDQGDVLTAAGSAAGIDLCLHVVRRQFGPEAANSVARRLVVPPHRDGGQAQFIPRPMPAEREGARLGPLIDAVRREPGEAWSIAAMASRAGMSLRTFQRRFEAATGLPPGEWLVSERVRLAQDMLEGRPAASLDDIALASGFGSPETMRHHFRSRVGVSPATYRARFSGAAS